jgi:tetratricopeptide (TPR) repeat protein
MAKNIVTRAWDAVKLPTVQGTKKPVSPQRRKQRRMIFGTLTVIALGLIGWAIYGYMGTAQQRAQATFDDAERLMSAGHYAKALDGFTRTLSIWPQMANAYVERGLAHHFMGEDQQALADLDRALGLDPNLSVAYAARGSISRDHGDVSRAMEEYSRSIQTTPNVDAFFERGQLYEKLGDHQKAIADYDQAIAYLRDAPHVYRARAFAKSNMGDEAGAKADRDLAHSLEHH